MNRLTKCAAAAAIVCAVCGALLAAYVCGGFGAATERAGRLWWKAKYTLRKAANTVGLGP